MRTMKADHYISEESVHLRTVFRAKGVQKVYTFLPDLMSALRAIAA